MLPDTGEITAYLHEHIPLSRAMGASVSFFDGQSAVLTAPLAPNINHRDTVFGGSASALGILACWTLAHYRLKALGMEARVVVMRNTVAYQKPISGEFEARAAIEDDEAWERFVRMLERKSIGRLTLRANLVFGGAVAGWLEGEFVASRPRPEK